MTTRADLVTALGNANVTAFLRAIRLGEGTSDDDGYRRIVGGQLFDDFSRHPRIRVWISRYSVFSTAAGAYQITFPTWTGLVSQYGFEDFSPNSQDQGAVALIIEKHALDDVVSGDALNAASLCANIWASLPASLAGQRKVSSDDFLAEYQKWGGTVNAG